MVDAFLSCSLFPNLTFGIRGHSHLLLQASEKNNQKMAMRAQIFHQRGNFDLKRLVQGGLRGVGYPRLPEGSQMEDMIPLPVSCLHHVAVERISCPPESNNSKRGLQGRGFGGFRGGGGTSDSPRGLKWKI